MEVQNKKEDEAEKRSTFAPKGGHLATLLLMCLKELVRTSIEDPPTTN